MSGFYYVLSDQVIYQCRGRGLFRKQKVSPLVGDHVVFESDNEREGTILEIEERRNELIRPPISNVEQALLVFSAEEPGFSPLLLDRFLVLIESKHINPIICISKMDLLNSQNTIDQINKYADDYKNIGYQVYLTSTDDDQGIADLRRVLDEKITVFAGQSGVGKSSLLNALNPLLELKTDIISESLGRGKHTTRHVELIPIDKGLVADTPGFSSLEFSEIEINELSDCFPEMVELKGHCKFRGCTHMAEPKCAVKDAVRDETIKPYRYEHYIQFFNEIKDRKPRY